MFVSIKHCCQYYNMPKEGEMLLPSQREAIHKDDGMNRFILLPSLQLAVYEVALLPPAQSWNDL